jgi:hypothetical protein
MDTKKIKGWTIGNREALDSFKLGEHEVTIYDDGWEIYGCWYEVTNYGWRLESIALAKGDIVYYSVNCSEYSTRFFEFKDGRVFENSGTLTNYVIETINLLNEMSHQG